MYIVSDELYNTIANKLVDAINGRSYFSGSVSLTVGDTECCLILTVIIYDKQVSMPDVELDIISDVVPVWWEFHTYQTGVEESNDFSFSSLRPLLINA